jgi:hypothetical protein
MDTTSLCESLQVVDEFAFTTVMASVDAFKLSKRERGHEVSPNVGDGRDQAAAA